MNPPRRNDKDLQGEGNYDATRRYDKAAKEFVESGRVEPAARAAEPEDAAVAESLERAEEIGKAHSKGEDATSKSATPKPVK